MRLPGFRVRRQAFAKASGFQSEAAVQRCASVGETAKSLLDDFMAPVLQLSNVAKTFTMELQGCIKLPVLHGFGLAVRRGECAVIADPPERESHPS